MTNTERIKANNAELRETIELAERLPDTDFENRIVVVDETTINSDQIF